jgi:hypothetical protein
LAIFLSPVSGRPLHLITLHGPGGQVIEINADEISSMREPQAPHKGHVHAATRCVITMTNGNFNAVRETCEQVDAILGHAEGREVPK